MWKALQHPNLLPLVGVIMTKNEFAMVSEWMENGNINQFVTAHQGVNRFELVSLPFKGLIPLSIVDSYVALVVGRCHKGSDLHS